MLQARSQRRSRYPYLSRGVCRSQLLTIRSRGSGLVLVSPSFFFFCSFLILIFLLLPWSRPRRRNEWPEPKLIAGKRFNIPLNLALFSHGSFFSTAMRFISSTTARRLSCARRMSCGEVLLSACIFWTPASSSSVMVAAHPGPEMERRGAFEQNAPERLDQAL
jgi:drug/metabolite transporter (DMT)-like permease